jgi:type I restriction enzyme S subunit
MSSEVARFGDLFKEPQRNGLTRPKKVRGSGLPMVNMGELFAYPRIRNIRMDLVPIDEKEHHYLLQPGDLLFARQSLVLSGAGQCSIFLGNDVPTVFESHLIRCRLSPKRSNPLFYFYFFRSPDGRRVIEAIVEQGAGASGIRGSDLVNVQVPNPPKQIQDEVAGLLGSIDDRITLLRETNTTLEAIAQALFKSWFLDFDPVHAKMQGRAPEGMDQATAALFPDSFVESELGDIPKGWRVGTLSTLAHLNPESWSAKQHPERIHYIDLANTKAGQIDDINEYSFDDAPSRARRVLRSGDVIVGTVRPANRSFARIATDVQGLTGSTGFAVLRACENFDQALVYIAATSDDAIDRLGHLADGGAYPAVRPEVVSNTPLIVAPELIRKTFGEVANALFAIVGANQDQTRVLAALRDTLLPRLISGQFCIPGTLTEMEGA